MTKLVLEKSESFNQADEDIKRKLNRIFGQKFESIDELNEELHTKRELPLTVHIPVARSVKIDTLPFTIKEWSLYYNKGPTPYGTYEIAKIKVIE